MVTYMTGEPTAGYDVAGGSVAKPIKLGTGTEQVQPTLGPPFPSSSTLASPSPPCFLPATLLSRLDPLHRYSPQL